MIGGVALCAGLGIFAPAAAPPTNTELEARYQDAVIALQENHPDAALGLFEWVLESVPGDHVLRPLATYGAARAAAISTTPGRACVAEAWARAYLARNDAEPSKREKLERSLPDTAARCIAERPPVAAPVVSSPPSAGTAVPTPPTETLADRLAAPGPAPAEPRDTVRLAGWISLAAGVALTAAGGYFWYTALEAQEDADAATTVDGHGRYVEDMETNGGLALGLTLAGGLGLVGGGGLLLYTGAK